MDTITTQLDNLSDLNDEQVAELQSSIISEFASVEQQDLSPETVDAMTSLAAMLSTVRDEVARREVAATELAARAAQAASIVHGEPTPDAADAADDVDALSTASASTEESAELATSEATIEAAPVVAAAEETPAEEVAEAPVEEAAVVAAAPEAPEAEVEAPAAEDAPVVAAAEETETPAEETTPDAEPEVEAPAAAADEATEEAAASTSEETDEPEAQEEASPVTAAADGTVEVPADRRPVVEVQKAPVAITAGADVPGLTAGSTINDMSGIAEAMVSRLHTLRHVNGGDGEQHTVATIHRSYGEDRTLTNSPTENQVKIDAALKEQGALTASGGHATPYPVNYDIFGFGTDARPVRDSLPSFQADRGGIRFVQPPVLSSYAGAVGVWTNATDTTPGGSTKNSLTVAGATEKTAATDAVTVQLQIGNFLSRAYPELVARHNELALIQHARVAELNLLSQIGAASIAVTAGTLIGAARDFLVNIRRAAAAYRSRNRIDPNTRLQAIIPQWLFDAMISDLTLNMPGDNSLGTTNAEIQGYLDGANVSLTASLDQNAFTAQSAGPLSEFPDSFTWYLFSEGSFLFLDGGTLDIGIIRDSTLVSTNDYKMFVETFEGLAFVGIESLAITEQLNVNGVAAALRDTTGGATAAAIEL